MSALLDALAPDVEEISRRLRRPSTVTVYGPPGSGKHAVVRAVTRQFTDRPIVVIRATDDSLAPRTAAQTIVGRLEDLKYRAAASTADQDDWPLLLDRTASTLSAADRDGVVVAVSDVDRLERLAEQGGAPGRHAVDLLNVLEDHARHRILTRTLPRRWDQDPVALSRADLSGWLSDSAAWGPLAEAAAQVAERGAGWTSLPMLTIRLCVGLSLLGFLPASPPISPEAPARSLADALASSRSTRPTWAAWQILAAVRSPWQPEALDELLADVPTARHEPIFTQCLTFESDGDRHMHPIVRAVAQQPRGTAADRRVAPSLLVDAGRRGVRYFRGCIDKALAGEMRDRAALARAQLVDCAAIAGEPDLAGELGEDLPDPYDHVGQLARAHQPIASRRGFELAKSVDQKDATALRGLADLADVEASDPARTETLLRAVLDLEPSDLSTHARLIEVLLAVGRPAAAEQAFDSARGLAGDSADVDTVGRLLVPVAADAVAHGDLALAIRAAGLAAELESSARTRDLARLADGLVEVLEYGEFTTVERLGTPWWASPDKLAGRHDGQVLSRWFAGRVDSVEDDIACIHYADVLVADRRPEVRSWLHLEMAQLEELSDDPLPDPLAGAILEIGMYGPPPQQDDEPEQEVVIRWLHGREAALPRASRHPDRYADAV